MPDHPSENLMRRALAIAGVYTRTVLPNPAVGAVLVANGTVIGAGCHERFGGPHAEVNAIRSVKDPTLLAQSTLYVTLEPCAHIGKTPPCVNLILASKIPRVVVGCRDPHPQVSGRGIEMLRDAGVSVTESVLHDECVVANRRFILAHKEMRPYIILKWAETSNGFFAQPNKQPIQISSFHSQQLLHYWRGQEMSIAVGRETVLTDNPSLTVRHLQLYEQYELPPRQPSRIIIGRAGGLPDDRALWNADAQTIAFLSPKDSLTNLKKGVLALPLTIEEPFLIQLCRALYQHQLLSLIVEGGARTLQSFIDSDLWDEMRIFTAPMKFSSGLPAPTLQHRPKWTTTSGPDSVKMLAHPSLAARLGIAESAIIPLLASAVPTRHYHQPTHSELE